MKNRKARFMVLGDSHVSFFSGTNGIVSDSKDVELFGNTFHIYHLGPALASSLVERQSTLMARERTMTILKNSNPADWTGIIFSFGEIDCRYHIIKRLGHQNAAFSESVRRSIAATVLRYVSFLQEVVMLGYQPLVWGPVATNAHMLIDPQWPNFGSMRERNVITREFTRQLDQYCSAYDIPVFTLLPFLLTERLDTNLKYYFDNGHLSQQAWDIALPLLRKWLAKNTADAESSLEKHTALNKEIAPVTTDVIRGYLARIDRYRAEARGQRGTIPSPAQHGVLIDPSCDVRGAQRMRFGTQTVIQRDCWLNIAFEQPGTAPMIEIGDGTNIGRRCTLSAANKIVIGNNVLFGPNVLVSDHNHEYRHAEVPIVRQGITTHTARVSIGSGSWIGANSAIVGNVSIGRQCVIGANSVVNRDIPDYCVAVGNPCRIVKIFDPSRGNWVSCSGPTEAEQALRSRRDDLLAYLTPITRLNSLQVEVSSACNLRCPQCFQFGGSHVKAFFPPDLWEARILPFLHQLKDIHLVGIGEPLLCKDFFRYVNDAVQHNVRVHTTSNLQLLDDQTAKQLVASGIQRLSFSCDGISRDTYDVIRVNGSIDVLRKSLRLIHEQKQKLRSAFPKLVLNFGGMKMNIKELPQIVDFAQEHHVDEIIAYHNVMYVPELKEESLYHDQELSDRMFREAKRRADNFGITLHYPGLFSAPIRCQQQGLYCGYPFQHLYIYSDGRVGPCCMDFPDRIILGDIRTAPIEEVWNSVPILTLRKDLSRNPSETCRYCVSHMKMDISDPNYLFRFAGSREYIASLPTNPCR